MNKINDISICGKCRRETCNGCANMDYRLACKMDSIEVISKKKLKENAVLCMKAGGVISLLVLSLIVM